jgi:hypothetical protein
VLLFCEVLVGDFSLELLFEVHLLEPPVLVFELLHARHHGGVHAAELGALLVERGAADAKLAADLRHCQTGFNTFQGSHDLAVGKSRLLHVELPSWKILLLGPLVYRGDYSPKSSFNRRQHSYQNTAMRFRPNSSRTYGTLQIDE